MYRRPHSQKKARRPYSQKIIFSDPRIIDEKNFKAKNLYLVALTMIVIKLMDKGIQMGVFRHSEGCRNNGPNQLTYQY